MKRLAWLTDLHLNFIDAAAFETFAAMLAQTEANAFVITGDIAEAPDFDGYLLALAERLGKPLLFVLGNHDFYRSSIEEVRARAMDLSSRSPLVRYLPAFGVIQITENTGLIGHDGWGDGRAGVGIRTKVSLADFDYIQDFAGLGPLPLFAKLNGLGDEAALHFRQTLPTALARFKNVLVATHVPPFVQACWHQGRMAEQEWQPHFACVAAGEALRAIARAHPDQRITVLCGHTHSAGHAVILPNLEVKTGAADYGRPTVQEMLEVE